MGIASFVIGIIALLFAFLPLVGGLAVVPAALGGLLGIIHLCRPKRKKGLAIAGVVLAVAAVGIGYGNFKATDALVTSLTGAETDLLALRETGLKREPDDTAVFHVAIENVSKKTIRAFRGQVNLLDPFDKTAHEVEVEWLEPLAPGERVHILTSYSAFTLGLVEEAHSGDSREALIRNAFIGDADLPADTLSALKARYTAFLDLIRYPAKAVFMCKDIQVE